MRNETSSSLPLGGRKILLVKIRLACADDGSNRWTKRLHASNPIYAGEL